MHEMLQQIRTELRGMWRYRWVTMIVAWAICLFGWLYVFAMPDIYEARAKVYVDADSRLAEVVGQVGVVPGVQSRVFVVRQAMLGRPQLERVARESDLDLRARTEEEHASLLDSLRDRVSISTGRTNESKNLYSISFEDRNRDMAIKVVQTLLDTFVEDVLRLKEQGVEEVTGYLLDQLDHYANLLSASELELADFKKKNVGLLPGENGGVFERLQVEMENLKQLQIDLRIETDRRDELRRQINSGTPMLPSGSEDSLGGLLPSTPTESAIAELQAQRSSLLLTFTVKHPDIVAIDEQLALLFEQRRQERSAGFGMEGAGNANNPIYQSAQIALNESSVLIAGLRSQVAQRGVIVRKLNNEIDVIPEIEAEFAQLTRNYAQYRSLYDELLEQKERERMGTVGDDRDVVSFNIIEPPSGSLDPIAPTRGIFIFAILAAALGVGGSVAFLLHQVNPVFHDVSTLRQLTGRPILGVVSMTWLERGRIGRRVDFSSYITAGMALMALFVISLIFQDLAVGLLQQFLLQVQV